MLKLARHHLDVIISHARSTSPEECCGLLGGAENNVQSIYKLNNGAKDPLVTYEATPEELFAAQRLMRARGEQLLAIYHSHPRAADPLPSETDVRLAFYPAAVYLIVGLAGEQPLMRAFRISEKEHFWEEVEYEIADG